MATSERRYDILHGAERLMGMDDWAWRRHASAWSVSTRAPITPLLLLSVYARRWIGWWCLFPVVLLIAWTFVNPRAFSAPQTFDGWAARATMGERLFLVRDSVSIPYHHWVASVVLLTLSSLGLIPAICGVVVYDPWATAFGALLTVGAKIWFCDRMAWMCIELDEKMGDEFPFRHLVPKE